MTEQHVADIRRKVKDLKKLERVLSSLAAQCHGKRVPDCPVIEALGGVGHIRSSMEIMTSGLR